MKNEDRDWNPQHGRGGIYCSPACGFRCKKKDFESITKMAAALAKRMGHGWKPHVWENLGWHYRVTNGLLEIHPCIYDKKLTYSAWIQTRPQFISGDYINPHTALKDALNKMNEKIAYYKKEAAKLHLSLKRMKGE